MVTASKEFGLLYLSILFLCNRFVKISVEKTWLDFKLEPSSFKLLFFSAVLNVCVDASSWFGGVCGQVTEGIETPTL